MECLSLVSEDGFTTVYITKAGQSCQSRDQDLATYKETPSTIDYRSLPDFGPRQQKAPRWGDEEL